MAFGDAAERLGSGWGRLDEGEADEMGEGADLSAPDDARFDGGAVGAIDDGDGAGEALGPSAERVEAHAAFGEVEDLAAVAPQALDLDAVGVSSLGAEGCPGATGLARGVCRHGKEDRPVRGECGVESGLC